MRDIGVTGVQTCALPIFLADHLGILPGPAGEPDRDVFGSPNDVLVGDDVALLVEHEPRAPSRPVLRGCHVHADHPWAAARVDLRSEARRVGKECSSRWSPYH